MVVLNLSQVSSFIYAENWPKSQKIFSDVKGDEKDDYKFVVQLYKPADITKGTEDIDKDREPKAQFHRIENKSVEWLLHWISKKKDPEFIRKYEQLIRDNLANTAPAMICDGTAVVDPKKIKSGSIWTIMPQLQNSASCKTTYALDSNPNTLSVLYLIPQYIVITISEVLNSVTGRCQLKIFVSRLLHSDTDNDEPDVFWGHVETGLEFAYSQAPDSMKSTVQSFWLLTTCIGNVIVIFLVSVKIGNTQVSARITHF